MEMKNENKTEEEGEEQEFGDEKKNCKIIMFPLESSFTTIALILHECRSIR